MRSLLILIVFVSFFVTGLISPFVMALGYIWVDLFVPQQVAFSAIIQALPVAFMTGCASIAGYLLFDRKAPPKVDALMVMLIIWPIWITLTTTWAVAPEPAWATWNASVKSVAFCAFLPFLIRSRIQIEAVVLMIVFSMSGNWLSAAVKVLISGGGYGLSLGLVG